MRIYLTTICCLFLCLLSIISTIEALSLSGDPASVYTDMVYIDPQNPMSPQQNNTIPEVIFQAKDDVSPVANSPSPNRNGLSGILTVLGDVCTNPPNITNNRRIPLIALIRDNENCTLEQQINIANNAPNVVGVLIYSHEYDGEIPKNDTVAQKSVNVTAYYVSMEVCYFLNERANCTDQDTSQNFTGRQIRVTLYPYQSTVALILEVTFIGIIVTMAVSFSLSLCIHFVIRRIRRQRDTRDPTAVATAVQMANMERRLPKAVLDTFPVRKFRVQGRETICRAGAGPNEIQSDCVLAEAKLVEDKDTKRVVVEGSVVEKIKDINNTNSGDILRNLVIDPREIQIEKGGSNKKMCSEIESNQPPSVIVTIPQSSRDQHDSVSTTPTSIKNEPFIMQKEPDILININNNVDTTPVEVSGKIIHSTCAVCLEDYQDEDVIRTLPCEHEYHSECVDLWLTRKSSKCPLCKFDCRPDVNKEKDVDCGITIGEVRGGDGNIGEPSSSSLQVMTMINSGNSYHRGVSEEIMTEESATLMATTSTSRTENLQENAVENDDSRGTNDSNFWGRMFRRRQAE